MKIHQTKNRKTKHVIELYKEHETMGRANWIDWYWCKCIWHDQIERFRHSRKSDALQAMAHPDEWCPECKAVLHPASLSPTETDRIADSTERALERGLAEKRTAKDNPAVLCRDVLTLCDGYGCAFLDSYRFACMLEAGHDSPHRDQFECNGKSVVIKGAAATDGRRHIKDL